MAGPDDALDAQIKVEAGEDDGFYITIDGVAVGRKVDRGEGHRIVQWLRSAWVDLTSVGVALPEEGPSTLKAALFFYANRTNWSSDGEGLFRLVNSPAAKDRGERARKTLRGEV